ncbi:MAG: MCE family protein [Acidimicrobiales bacterium]|jgi:phospholipid/cholesterol/gamma-HCH transport system substrate-binding protein
MTRRWAPVLVIAGALCLAGCGIHGASLQSLPKLGEVTGPTYPIYATFSNVLNLPIEGQVRVGPQVVGAVTGISASDFQASVTMKIEKNVTLLKGTTAQVRFDNPLGDEYVLLTAPADTQAPHLRPGAEIPESDTSTAPSVEDTLGALSLVLNGGGINQLQTIIHELNNTFTGNQPQIRSLLRTVNAAVSKLAGGRQAVDDFLASASSLTRKLNGNGGAGAQTIAKGISSIAPAIGVLTSENTSLDSLFGALSNLGAVGSQIEQQSGQNAVDDVTALLPVVNQLNGVSEQLGPVLSDLSRFEAETPKIAPGDYVQVGVVANVILPPGDFAPNINLSGSVAGSGAHAVTDLLDGGLS